LTYGSYSKASNSLDKKDNYKLEIGLDTEYYLKIVPSEWVHPFWGIEKFYEYSYK